MKPIYCKHCKYFVLHRSGIYECRKLIEVLTFNKITGLPKKSTAGFHCDVANQDNNCQYFEPKTKLRQFMFNHRRTIGITIACIIYIAVGLIGFKIL